jgi:hypothetical protein
VLDVTRFRMPQRRPRRQPEAEQQAPDNVAQAEAIRRFLDALAGPRTEAEPEEDP